MGNITDVLNDLIRPILALVGFGSLTFGFIIGGVTEDTYVPIVALMIGYFFRDVTDTVQAVRSRRRTNAERDE